MNKLYKIFFTLLAIFSLGHGVSFANASPNYTIMAQQGIEAYKAGNYQIALQYLTGIPKNEHTLEIVLCIANSYESLGDARSAVLLLESLNRRNINNYTAFYNLGNIYLKAKVYKNAIESYKLATRMNTKFAPAHYNLGIAYFEAGDVNNALFYFEKAIRLNPANKDYYYNAAICHEAIGDKKTAAEYFEKAK